MTDARPEPGILGRVAPDLTLSSSSSTPFRLHEALSHGPVVLFFFIHSATPG